MLTPAKRKYLTEEELEGFSLTETNVLMKYHKSGLKLLRSCGYLAVNFDGKKGTLESKWLSYSLLHCVLMLAIAVYFMYIASIERVRILNMSKKWTFDEALFLYSLFPFYMFKGIHISLILESKNFTHYYNQFAKFQARYYHVNGEPIDFRGTKQPMCRSLSILGVLFGALLVSNVFNVGYIYRRLEDWHLLVENVISITFVILDFAAIHFSWFYNIYFLKLTAIVIGDDVMGAYRKGDDSLAGDYQNLWIDLMYLVKDMSNSFTYSLGYYATLAVICATFEMYLAFKDEHAILILYASGLTLSVLSFLASAEHLMTKMTRRLKDQLLVHITSSDQERRRHIRCFLRIMSNIGGSMSLGGYFTLSHEQVSSVLNTITTYLIILLQFKQIDMNSIPGDTLGDVANAKLSSA